ncbi:MAG: polyprenyl diphosphate synthase [Gammaproteobacteria bacterium]|jgi:undecaprenyl diphosphate synthase
MNQQTIRSVPLSSAHFATQSCPRHVAIIMDGNRRWARERRLPAAAGHRAGLDNLERLLPAVRNTGIVTLTLFGFASANWQRQRGEVTHLMRLAEEALERFTPRCVAERIRIEVLGRKDRLPRGLQRGIEQAQNATLRGSRSLRIALDYSSREAILAAAADLPRACDSETFGRRLGGPEVDLLIRTGKEQRLSDFLLWECAFAELYFPDLYWPEFDAAALEVALDWFGQRNRRFGR